MKMTDHIVALRGDFGLGDAGPAIRPDLGIVHPITAIELVAAASCAGVLKGGTGSLAERIAWISDPAEAVEILLTHIRGEDVYLEDYRGEIEEAVAFYHCEALVTA